MKFRLTDVRCLLAGASLLLICGCSGSPGASPASVGPAPAPAITEAVPLVVERETWTFANNPGEVLRTPSYAIFTTVTRPGVNERLPAFMEAALAHYTSALTPLPPPPSPLETYILGTRQQWTQLTQSVMGADAALYLRIDRGGFAERGRAILFDIGPRDTFIIAAHEGWHQYTQRTFRTPLPVWLEEGIATYMEGFRWSRGGSTSAEFLPWLNIERFDQLRAAQRSGSLLSLPELLRTSPQELMARDESAVLTYYAQVWALTHFLVEGEDGRHREGLTKAIQDAASGRLRETLERELGSRAARSYTLRRRGAELLPLYFRQTPEQMDAAYQQFIRTAVRPGAKQLIVFGRTPMQPMPQEAPR